MKSDSIGITDLTLKRALWERMFGLGTIHCCSGDKTSPEFDILHIKDVRRVKDMLSDMVEEERAKKRIGTRELLDDGDTTSRTSTTATTEADSRQSAGCRLCRRVSRRV